MTLLLAIGGNNVFNCIMTLYIIGNGFDLAHGLETSYCDYRRFIKANLERHYKWDFILDFYPDDYEFWSDIEFNVCKINIKHYLSLKKVFGFGLLDDLLRQIHYSFEAFILNRESSVFSTKSLFRFDSNSYFFTFNYTSVLEDVYGIDKNKILYLHNDIAGPSMEILYNIQNRTPCIIGHSPIKQDYAVYNEMLTDKEYGDYVKYTTKNCNEVLEQKGVVSFLENNKNTIEKVVFYGFSFSITDKIYVKTIFDIFKNTKTSFSIFYKIPNDQTEQSYLDYFKTKVSNCDVSLEKVTFINCEGVTKI